MKPIHQNLDHNHHFEIYGYKIYKNEKSDYLVLKDEFSDYMKNNLEIFSGRKINNFKLENYHQTIDNLDLNHHEFIKSISRVLPEKFLHQAFIKKIIDISNQDLDSSFDIYTKKIEFRVVRPGTSDNNERHRDHWFPYLLPLVNIYVPLAGSYYNSAMRIVPFSHKWSDDDVVPTFTYEESKKGKKFIKNGIAYSVPAVKFSSKKIVDHSPDVAEGDFMLFSPMLVHGGGGNASSHTRFSFEIRLEKIIE